MKKSIFKPLMWLSLSIILTTAVIMGCIHIVLINKYIISAKTNIMLQNAQRISELTSALSGGYSSQLEAFYTLNMDLISQSTQSHIIVTDTKGNIVNFSTPTRKYFLNKTIDISAFSDALNGENVYKVGAFDNMFSQRIFTIAVPVKIDGGVHGIVFFNSPLPELYRDKYTLFSMLAVSIFV